MPKIQIIQRKNGLLEATYIGYNGGTILKIVEITKNQLDELITYSLDNTIQYQETIKEILNNNT